ncbi:MAG: hypothetical protein H7Y02_05490, partial [Candidatus Obscuribacterales bacterium]|nr:hypothetical protein [Steroidobacteraceae bacterium]
MRILRAHINLILGTVLVAVLATTVATKLTPHHYVATSSLLVSIDEGVHASYAESPAAQIDVLTSKIVAGAVVDRLRLVNDPLRQARFLASNESLLARLRGMRS